MPNWTKVTTPVSSFEADKSTGVGLATAAQGLEAGVNLIDTTAKDIIKKDVRSTVDPIREDFTNQLIQARDQALGASGSGSGSSATNILPSGETPVQPPNGVQSGIQKVQSLQLAQENGKVNDTYYDMRLKTAVTDLRSKYPGYVDYIDSQVSSITGVNPANALVNNLMQDINRLQSNKKSSVDTMMDQVMKSGYTNSIPMMQKLQTDGEKALPEVREWYARQTEFDSGIKRREAIRTSNKGTKEDIADSRKADFTNEAGANLSSALDAMTTVPGVNTPQKTMDVIADAAANPGKHSDDEMRLLATQLGVQAAQWESGMRARARTINKDSDGRSFSYISDIGASSVDEIIKQGRQSFQLIQDALIKGGPEGMGAAYIHANHAKAILDGGKDSLLSDKDLGTYATFMATSRELFGDNWTNATLTSGLKNSIDKKIDPYLANQLVKARTGYNQDGKPVTLAQQIDEGKALEDQSKITANQRSRYSAGLVNIVDDIKNPKAPIAAKEKVIDYIFSPEGQGVLSKFKTDYTDPITGKQIPGKYSVFERLTSNDIVKEVKGMDAEHQQKYKNYLEREAGAEIFQKEFLNLNHFTGHDNLHFKYNDGGQGGVPHIELIDNAGALASPVGQDSRTFTQRPPAANYIFQVQKIVDRVNSGLSGMSRVEKGFGGNANDYILDFLVNKARVDMGTNWEGLPGKLVDAIAASRAPARRIEDTFKDVK